MGARSNGIAYTTASLSDLWGVFNNIAGIATTDNLSAGCSYDVNPKLTGANRMAAVLAIPMRFGVAGGGVFRFGDDFYNEHLVSVGFANKFGLAALGTQVNYIQYSAEGFGTKNVWSMNLGGIAELSPKLSIGAYIINVTQPKMSDGEKLPTRLVAGIGFKPVQKVFIATEIEKDLDYDAVWKMGMEYKIHPKFSARTGYTINPRKFSFGLGFYAKKFVLDYAIQYNAILSLSHQASVNYTFSRP